MDDLAMRLKWKMTSDEFQGLLFSLRYHPENWKEYDCRVPVNSPIPPRQVMDLLELDPSPMQTLLLVNEPDKLVLVLQRYGRDSIHFISPILFKLDASCTKITAYRQMFSEHSHLWPWGRHNRLLTQYLESLKYFQ